MRSIELARTSPLLAPSLDELPILRELNDPCVGVTAVSIGDEDIAVCTDDHIRRLVESIRAIACNARFPERQQHFSFGAKLENLLAFAVRALTVSDPDVILAVD